MPNDAKKYLDLAGLQSYNKKLLVDTVGSIISAYDSNTRTFTLDTYTMPTEGDNAGKVVKTSSSPLTLGTAALADVSTEGVKLNDTGLVTGGQVYTAIQGITEPMLFKGNVYIVNESGTLKYYNTRTGEAGSYEYSDEITASTAKSGYTYKVITSDDSDVKVGDTLIANVTSNTLTWTVIPSGDEPSGTVTSISVSDGLSVVDDTTSSTSAITTSGTITLEPATTSTLGGVSVASGSAIINTEGAIDVKVDGATISKNGSNQLAARVATSALTGVVSVPTDGGLTVTDGGAISVKNGTTITKANDGTLDVNKGTSIKNTNGVLDVNIDGVTIKQYASGETDEYKLYVPTATNNALGVVKVNTTNGISLDSNSTLKVNTADANGIIVDSTSNKLTLKLTATSGIKLNTTSGAEGYEIETIDPTTDINALFA